MRLGLVTAGVFISLLGYLTDIWGIENTFSEFQLF